MNKRGYIHQIHNYVCEFCKEPIYTFEVSEELFLDVRRIHIGARVELKIVIARKMMH
jgi:hypothetical protein